VIAALRSGRLLAAAALLSTVALGSAASAQTLPQPPREADLVLDLLGDVLHPLLDEAAAVPTQLTSAVLEGAPVVGPLYATYARGDFEPPVAIDVNDDPDVVEVNIVAVPAVWEFRPGVPTVVWTFNGTIPGPTIEAKVGDEVIVHYTNLVQSPHGGSIHWHGVEVPARMDGSHVSAPPIPFGGSFEYRFRVNRAALFWYHPHHQASEEVERGQYGALLVHDAAADEALGVANQRILVLDDVYLDGSGQFKSFLPARPEYRAAYLANGREELPQDGYEGTLLVNGRAGRILPVEPGVPLRLRMVNTANSRFMRVNVPGHDLHLIGTDGGLFEAPELRTPIQQVLDPDPTHGGIMVSDNDPDHGVLLTPGERADVILVPTGPSGSLLDVEWHDWARGRHYYYVAASGDVILTHVHGTYPSLEYQRMFSLQLAGEGPAPSWAPPSHLRTIERLEPAPDAKRLQLTLGHGNPERSGDITFWMEEKDGVPLPFPQMSSADVNQAMVGDVAIWEVKNTAHGDHNFHTHGFMFQPLEVEYWTCDETLTQSVFVRKETFDFLQEKDTIRIPGPPMPACYYNEQNIWICPICPTGTAYTLLRAAVRFDDEGGTREIEAHGKVPTAERSGGWMVHCHILEHAERGMMSFFEIRKPTN